MAQVTRGSSAPALGDAFAQVAPYVAPAGRALMSVIFLLSGAMKFVNWQQMADYMASKDMPFVPVLLPAAALVEILGGLSLLLGLRARIGALALFVFLIPTTLVFHNFWAHSGMEQMNQMQHFLKNLTIMGGLLVIVGLGSGPLSLDASWRKGPTR
jgi:putative oxidoreductase